LEREVREVEPNFIEFFREDRKVESRVVDISPDGAFKEVSLAYKGVFLNCFIRLVRMVACLKCILDNRYTVWYVFIYV
jgi:hypothetical protein